MVKFNPLIDNPYYGNNIDEVLQMRVKDPTEAGAVVSLDNDDDEIETGDQYDDDDLIGRMIIVKDNATPPHRGQFRVTDNAWDGQKTVITVTGADSAAQLPTR